MATLLQGAPSVATAAAAWLPQLPIQRDDSSWTYWLLDPPHRFPVSITGVLSRVLKSEEALSWIEAWRSVWEPRGNTTHAALQHFALHRWQAPPKLWPLDPVSGSRLDCSGPPEPDGERYGAYGDWIRPLLVQPIWEHVQVVGAEVMLYDLALNVAGTIDLILRFPDGSYGLADLKTLSHKGRKYDTRAQLGAGMVLAQQRHGLRFSRGLTLWAAPGACRIQTHTTEECVRSWETVFSQYAATWRPF
jgi:hypothetical protein